MNDHKIHSFMNQTMGNIIKLFICMWLQIDIICRVDKISSYSFKSNKLSTKFSFHFPFNQDYFISVLHSLTYGQSKTRIIGNISCVRRRTIVVVMVHSYHLKWRYQFEIIYQKARRTLCNIFFVQTHMYRWVWLLCHNLHTVFCCTLLTAIDQIYQVLLVSWSYQGNGNSIDEVPLKITPVQYYCEQLNA